MTTSFFNQADRFTIIAIITIASSLVIGMFGGYAWEIGRDRLRPTIDVDSNHTLELYGQPGQDVSFYITITNTLNHWDSDGLKIILGDLSAQVTSEHRDDWGEAISTSAGGVDDIKITGQFRIPELNIGQKLSGKITGSIDYAKPDSGGKFSNSYKNVDIPVSLEVLSPEDAATNKAMLQGLTIKIYPILLGISAGLMAAGIASIISYVVLNRRIKHGTSAPIRTPALGYLMLSIIGVVICLMATHWLFNDQGIEAGKANILSPASETELQELNRQNQDNKPQFKDYTDLQGGGYSLSYPYDWIDITCPQDTLHLGPDEASAAVCNSDRASLVTVTVVPIETAAEWEVEENCAEATDNKYRTETECSDVKKAGVNWLRITYTGTEEASTSFKNADVISYLARTNGKLYLIIYAQATDYPDEKEAFEQIVDSFKFTE